jgi:iron(III) transport system ATP-binding protein
MSGLLWRLDHVSVGRGARPRLADVSVEINPGTTAVLGISGAGKTTLLNLLCGFSKPEGGRIEPLLPSSNGRLPLYWVPQNDGLWPQRTVRAHVEEVLANASVAGHAGRSADDWLADFDLSNHAHKSPDQLSHGERNRLSVVRALASGASVLIMDEPMAHVDPARINVYWDHIRRHVRETRASLVLATHSPEVALSEAEHAVCLREGRIIYNGPMRDLYSSPATPELAVLLGPANWLTAGEVRQWLAADAAEDRCYRPEQIAISPAAEGPFVVEEARFAGAVAEVELHDSRSGSSRRFFHRPAGPRLAKGSRVVLRVIASLVACLLISACSSGDDPALPIREIHYWSMPPKGSKIPAPRSVTCGPESENYILDKAGRVVVFSETGELLRKWDMPDARIGNPEGACIFSDGRIAIADTHYSRVVFFNREGKLLGMMGSEGKGPGQFIYPVCVARDPQDNFYVGEYGGNDRVQKFSPKGEFLLQIGRCGSEPGEFQRASGVVWHNGLLYVADAFNNRIQVFSDKGEFQSVFGRPESGVSLGYPYALAAGPADDLFVIEYSTARVSRFSFKDGRLLGRFGKPGRGEGEFATPWGIDVNSKGTILVADTDNRRIVELRR